MRGLPLTIMAALFLVPLTTAQEDGCTSSDPCDWLVDVGPDGIAADGLGAAEWNWTAGDWFAMSIYNDDDVAHTVTLDGVGSWEVPALDIVDTGPFQFAEAGTFVLSDAPTGDTAQVHVLAGDVVDAEAGAADGAQTSEGAPGFGVMLAGAAMLSVLFIRRR